MLMEKTSSMKLLGVASSSSSAEDSFSFFLYISSLFALFQDIQVSQRQFKEKDNMDWWYGWIPFWREKMDFSHCFVPKHLQIRGVTFLYSANCWPNKTLVTKDVSIWASLESALSTIICDNWFCAEYSHFPLYFVTNFVLHWLLLRFTSLSGWFE